MHLSSIDSGTVKVVLIEADTLDASSSKAFKAAMAPFIANNAQVVLDLSRLKFVDSSGLGAMLSSLRQLNAAGGDLRLCGMNKQIRALFQLVRMHRVFEIHNSPEEAARSWSTQETGPKADERTPTEAKLL